jgi:crossover junction endodeoxyribonuclease RusA
MVLELPPAAVAFTVFGIPATAGNKTAFPIKGRDGRMHVAVREGKQAGPAQSWRARVEEVVQELARDGAPLLDGPVKLVVDFYLPRPKSAPKRRRTWPDRKPDLSKLLRAIEDPMKGVVLADDARIVELRASKDYAYEGDRPRAEVRLWRLQDLEWQPVDDGEQLSMQRVSEVSE